MMTDVYNRQYNLPIRAPRSAVVVGVGGVGAWVALELALIGVDTVFLVDADVVEETNLNRTPFTMAHIGMSKVSAVADLIAERRPMCDVTPFECRVEKLPDYALELLAGSMLFDCRDSITPIDVPRTIPCGITGGYDGTSVTIHTDPNPDSIFGAHNVVRYTTTPSFVGAPTLIASIIVNYVCLSRRTGSTEKVLTFDLRDIVDVLENGCNV